MRLLPRVGYGLLYDRGSGHLPIAVAADTVLDRRLLPAIGGLYAGLAYYGLPLFKLSAWSLGQLDLDARSAIHACDKCKCETRS